MVEALYLALAKEVAATSGTRSNSSTRQLTMVSLFVVYGRPLFLLLLQHVVGISFAGRSGQGSRTAFPNDSNIQRVINTKS